MPEIRTIMLRLFVRYCLGLSGRVSFYDSQSAKLWAQLARESISLLVVPANAARTSTLIEIQRHHRLKEPYAFLQVTTANEGVGSDVQVWVIATSDAPLLCAASHRTYGWTIAFIADLINAHALYLKMPTMRSQSTIMDQFVRFLLRRPVDVAYEVRWSLLCFRRTDAPGMKLYFWPN
jgi:hypothetical protein